MTSDPQRTTGTRMAGRAMDSVLPGSPRWALAGRAALGQLAITALATALVAASLNMAAGIAFLVGLASVGTWLAVRDGARAIGHVARASALSTLAIALVAWGAQVSVGGLDAGSSVLAAALIAFLAFAGYIAISCIGALAGVALVTPLRERRHRQVAAGERPLVVPAEERTTRSRASGPLDDVGLARITDDGAATTVVRIYPWTTLHETWIADDTTRLRRIGYAVVERTEQPPRAGVVAAGVGLLQALLVLLDLVTALSGRTGASVSSLLDDSANVTLTFRLRSRSHASLDPSPVDT